MHHDTITGTSRQYVVNKAIAKIEGIMGPNSKKLALLFMQRMAEVGVKVKDFMHHLRPGYNENPEVIDLSKANETLVYVYNPSLDYLDTTLLQVQGADIFRLYVWVPETQRWDRVTNNQSSPHFYYERLCNEAECSLFVHHMLEPLSSLIFSIVTHSKFHQGDEEYSSTTIPLPGEQSSILGKPNGGGKRGLQQGMPEAEFRQFLLKDQEANRTRRYHKDRRVGDPLDLKGKPRFQWTEPLADVKAQYKDRVLSNDYCKLIVTGVESGSLSMRYRESNQLID